MLSTDENGEFDKLCNIIWSETANGEFTISSAVKALRDRRNIVDWFNLIWFKKHIPCQSFISWLALSGGLLTQDKMKRQGLIPSSQCIFCRLEPENEFHLFFDCSYSNTVWQGILVWLNYSRVTLPAEEEAMWILNNFTGSDDAAVVRKLAFNSTIYRLWLERNSRRFKNSFSPPHVLIQQITMDCKMKLSASRVEVIDCPWNRVLFENIRIHANFGRIRIVKCKWQKPDVGWISLNCDGSLRENMDGIGGLLRDRGGAILSAFAGGCASKPIYALQITAVEQGMKMALELGCTKLQVLSDSNQAVEVIKGLQRTPWLIKEEVRLIRRYGELFDEWNISHVFREVNRPADFLAGLCNDIEVRILAHDGIPDDLKLLVDQDTTRGCTYYRSI